MLALALHLLVNGSFPAWNFRGMSIQFGLASMKVDILPSLLTFCVCDDAIFGHHHHSCESRSYP